MLTASSVRKWPSSETLFGLEGAVNAEGEPLLDYPDENQNVLSRCEVLASISYMLHLVKQEPGYRLDDQDHFANRRIRSVGELIQNQVRIGLSRMERVVRERMTTQDVEAITPQTLINIRPVVVAIKEFFGTSQAAQFMDQVNPLSGLMDFAPAAAAEVSLAAVNIVSFTSRLSCV